MIVQHIAAFSAEQSGGNPAGVVLLDAPTSSDVMARVARSVGYSETVFAVPFEGGKWRVRYFSPETEIPFCGHATIALGAVLGRQFGVGVFDLVLNEASISVDVEESGTEFRATLLSPPTTSRLAGDSVAEAALTLFGLDADDLDQRFQLVRINAGAEHLLMVLKNRDRLAAMSYDLQAGREVMRKFGLVTIMLAYVRGDAEFDVRNAFASGGVMEDPATGAAAAAFAGYLRDIGWPHGLHLAIRQGDDMGIPCIIRVELTGEVNAPVKVTGETRIMRTATDVSVDAAENALGD